MSHSASQPHRQHVFDEKNLREDIRLAFKGTKVKVRVFFVESGDSGKQYAVQYIEAPSLHGRPICICNCQDGTFKQPGEILGVPGFRCKHAQALIEVLRMETE
jgi:hypothetical protein